MNEKQVFHVDRTGKKIKISDLSIRHLMNIVLKVHNDSIKGVQLKFGAGLDESEFSEEDKQRIFSGQELKDKMNFDSYRSELMLKISKL